MGYTSPFFVWHKAWTIGSQRKDINSFEESSKMLLFESEFLNLISNLCQFPRCFVPRTDKNPLSLCLLSSNRREAPIPGTFASATRSSSSHFTDLVLHNHRLSRLDDESAGTHVHLVLEVLQLRGTSLKRDMSD